MGTPERKRPLGRLRHRWENLAITLYTWQHISHLLHVVNQCARKFVLTTHTNPFRKAAPRRSDERR